MLKKIQNTASSLWSSGYGAYILVALLFFAIFIAPPLINEGLLSEVVLELAFVLVLVLGVFAIPTSRMTRIAMFILAFCAIGVRFLHQTHDTFYIAVINDLLAIITLAVFSVLIVKRFMWGNERLSCRIAAAVAVYLLLGLIWARLYGLLHYFEPSSFSIPTHEKRYALVYFSFVTLLTIGYGDIVPVSVLAQSLAIAEGVVGQLYMVILISCLVSEFSANHAKRDNL